MLRLAARPARGSAGSRLGSARGSARGSENIHGVFFYDRRRLRPVHKHGWAGLRPPGDRRPPLRKAPRLRLLLETLVVHGHHKFLRGHAILWGTLSTVFFFSNIHVHTSHTHAYPYSMLISSELTRVPVYHVNL